MSATIHTPSTCADKQTLADDQRSFHRHDQAVILASRLDVLPLMVSLEWQDAPWKHGNPQDDIYYFACCPFDHC
jgi:hypothetical protein